MNSGQKENYEVIGCLIFIMAGVAAIIYCIKKALS